jgi:multidrug efflux pump subunit AcrA (membrane-fusion protein)
MGTTSRHLGYGAALLVVALAADTLRAQAPPPTPVVAMPVVRREVPAAIKLVGTVRANREALVAAEIGGVVVSLPAAEGQFLKTGEVLCELDAVRAEYRLAEARARLGSLQAQLEELENGTREELLRQLAAQVEEAQAIYDKWQFERKRVEELFSRNQSSAKEKHDTEMEYLAAKQRLTQYRAAHEIAVNGPRREELARARYDVAAQEAVVRRLQRDLERTKIRAPFDGFVVARRTEVGEWIDEGGPVCEMVALDTVKVRADVPESAVSFSRAGAPATVYFEALDKTYSATISRVIPRAEPAARTFPVEIDLPNPNHTLLAGMFAWTYVPAGPKGQRLMVHKDAIVSRGLSKQVFVVRPGPDDAKLAIPTPVTTGLEIAEEIEIQAPGIQPGDLVVTRANERLFGPTPVIPTLESASPTTQPGATQARIDSAE